MSFWKKRIGFKVVFFTLLILIPVMGGFFYIDINVQSRELIERTKKEIFRLSDTIKKSVEYDMLKAERENIQKIIETIADQPEIEKVRVFNKEGKIMVAADRSSIGKLVDRKAEACFGCHEDSKKQEVLSSKDRVRIYRMENRGRMLGMINPIYNKKTCFGCHDKDQKVLGVLDIVISLRKVDREIAQRKRRALTFAFSTLLLLSAGIGLSIYHSVNQPIKQLLIGTRKIAKGELNYEIPFRREDEIGELARSFNRMTKDLKKSKDENERWNRELDQRVKRATTELELANQQLKQLSEAKSEAVMTVAHELKAPLSSIWTLLNTVVKGYTGEVHSQQKEIIERAEKRTKLLVTLVKDILDFSLIESGRVEVDMKPLKVNDILEKIIDVLRSSAEERGIHIKLIKPESSPLVMANEEYLERLFTNLVSNAIKYNKPNGSVTIREEALGENVRVEVSDTGVGIPQTDLPKVFDILYRGSYARGKESDGVGLGLSIAKRIIKLHKGKIWVESEEGKGSRFYVLLPQATSTYVRRKVKG